MNSFRILSLLILGLFLILGGCSESFFDSTPRDRIPEELFWKSPIDIELALNAVYQQVRGIYGGAIYLDVLTPNAYNQYDSEGWAVIAEGNHDSQAPGQIVNLYATCYRGIGRVNRLLDNLHRPVMDSILRSRIRGEALFLRALFYHNLVTFFGGVVLIYETPTAEKHARLPRNSRTECIDSILADLARAASLLPISPRNGQRGRATRGAANALKARVLLYEGRWAEAVTAADTVIRQGTYSLHPDYRRLFLQTDLNKNEVIFDLPKGAPDFYDNWDNLLAPSIPGPGFSSISPMRELVNDYYMANGLPITDTTSGYNPATPYINRDPRLAQTIFYPGSTRLGVAYNPAGSRTTFSFKKYTSYDSAQIALVPVGQSANNFLIIRYADVLLMLAEAENEANGGPNARVYDAINQVRARARMPNVATGLTQAQMRAEIRHERRIELAGEGLYYHDIRRWRIAETVIPALTVPETRRFNPARDYLWPIPYSEFALNPNLLQNPNYEPFDRPMP